MEKEHSPHGVCREGRYGGQLESIPIALDPLLLGLWYNMLLVDSVILSGAGPAWVLRNTPN